MMRRVIVFNMISSDGYFEGPNHELDWHNVDAEFNSFAVPQLQEVDTLVFGRRTYEMMASFWPTETAKKQDPAVAGLMNTTSKLVFSRTLDSADWERTTLITEHAIDRLKELKEKPGKALLILGSSNLCVSLLGAGLIDEIRLIVNPVVLGKGNPIFAGLHTPLRLHLLGTQTFKSNNILLRYGVNSSP